MEQAALNQQPSSLPSTAAGSERYDFLDWLRVIAILVLLFYHTGMIFVGWGWHVMNEQRIDALVAPMDISHRLRMPLLFVIAGAGMWFALQRRTGAQLFRERTVRLLLPLVIGMFVIVPPQVFYERLFQDRWQGGFLQFLWERTLQLRPYPEGDFSWHHLWFIAYLYVYVPLLLPLMIWWRRSARKLQAGAWMYTLALPLAINEAVLKPLFPETHNLVRDWYIFNHYLLLTVYGYLLASMPGVWQWFAMRRHQFAIGGVSVYLVAMWLFAQGVIHRSTPADAFVGNVFTWLWLMAFLGYGYRHLSFCNPLLRWARDASYPIYILHQTLIVAIGYYVVQTSWSPWTKYWGVLLATLVSCVLLYQLIVRRFGFTRFVFGMKRGRATDAPSAMASERGSAAV
ncbi:acyltransferase family protein [Steroidobacter cummioxidans]|uniref:acyltransferase family protein n=1 Tax=Steroidobacter cummioxidans TaxID=1803913 RepID=UPI000E31E2F1|nr:acyltransferase family protein [Steroidobacter cummioxidans]